MKLAGVAIGLLARQWAVAPGLFHVPAGVVAVGRRGVPGSLAGAHGRVEVNEEGEDVEGEDEGDQPLEDGGGVPVAGPVAADESDGQDDFQDDEREFDPE